LQLLDNGLYIPVFFLMRMQSDPNQLKESQRKSWDSVSKGWQTWWKTIENGAYNISNRLVELANVKPRDRVLDIATGIGEPAITAAKRVGSNGHVMATDISPLMFHCKAKGCLHGYREHNGL
jgi:ubiquinone/menaquinone biosynthesis C-methylase UbiE